MAQDLDHLTPTLDQLAPRVRDAALPEIADAALRRAVVADANLQDDILQKILCDHGFEPNSALERGAYETQLKAVLAMPLEDLCLRLGAAAHAEVFSKCAVTQIDAIEANRIPRDVVKASLRHQGITRSTKAGALPDREGLEADGVQTLHCWLTTVPAPVALLISLRLPQAAQRLPASENDQRKRLCEDVLATLVKTEAVQ